jgi:2-methylcitrate dehydratase PrpD
MIQPYLDCALRLHARGVAPAEISEIVCKVGEGTVHRLWEPLGEKQRPPNGYAAKFATPYCIAHAIVKGSVGLDAFDDRAVSDSAVTALAAKIRYEIDPADPYPRAFTGDLRARLADGRTIEERQPHMRGGASEPLTRAEIEEKFKGNALIGGWTEARIASVLAMVPKLWSAPRIDLGELRG